MDSKISPLKSLNTKLLAVVLCFVFGGGVLSAYYQARAEERLLLRSYNDNLQRLGARYSNDLAANLIAKQEILESVRDLVIYTLEASEETAEEVVNENAITRAHKVLYQRDKDGAVRLIERGSGVFVPEFKSIDIQTQNWLNRTGPLWENLSAPLASIYDAFYLIANTGVSRVYPSAIVGPHLPSHDITGEVFYQIATPANNPKIESLWTPTYYDPYIKQWMISLIVPVYIDSVFFGVLGGDINLNYFLRKLKDLESLAEGAEAFVFDGQGNVLLLQGEDQKQLAHLRSPSYQVFSYRSEEGDGVQSFINATTSGKFAAGQVIPVEFHGRAGYAVYQPVSDINWGLVVFYPLEVVAQRVKPMRISIYLSALFLAALLSLVLYLSLSYFVTQRIRRLAYSTSNITEGHWDAEIQDGSNDEIGVLGRSINTMLDKINELIGGLHNNIVRLEVANLELRKLTNAVEHSPNSVAIINALGEHEYGNRSFWELSGYDVESSKLGMGALLLPASKSVDVFWKKVTSALEEGDEWRGEYKAQGAKGRQFWLAQAISVVRDESHIIQYYICSAKDITDVHRQRLQMEQLAYYDQLTGLQNRVLFKSHLQSALKVCEREAAQLALLYLDLDHFKVVNDTMGHEAGDLLLIEVAERLKRCLRPDDSVARLGGDEFSILLNRIGNPQFASIVAAKINRTLAKPFHINGQEVDASVSIGITLAPTDSSDINTLMKNADLAMYEAKSKGRNSFQFYTSEMNREVASRLKLEREMRQAITKNEFILYYQPQVDLKTGQIIGAEALIRWKHPILGLVPPLDFIPMAEETGMIVPIGKWIIRTACQQAKSIKKSLDKPIKISINISSKQLKEPHFIDELQSILSELRVDPSLIELEVTESVLMEDIQAMSKVLRGIRALGIDLSIDDFGTGYSSLSYLKRLPVSTLKVDREFVKGLPDDKEDRTITGLIVTMAGALKHKVVVEGVETIEQLSFLADIGCDYAQGFYYSEPVPADELMLMLFEWDVDKALDWKALPLISDEHRFE